jgi:hypothetical protein
MTGQPSSALQEAIGQLQTALSRKIKPFSMVDRWNCATDQSQSIWPLYDGRR